MKEQAWLTGMGPLALTMRARSRPSTYSIGEDQAAAGPEGEIGGDDVGMPEPGDGADLAEEAVEHAGAVDDVAADEFEDLITAHDLIVGEEDQSHRAAAQLADDFVVGDARQFGWDRIGPDTAATRPGRIAFDGSVGRFSPARRESGPKTASITA